MTLEEAIYKRKTTRSFDHLPLDDSVLRDIMEFGKTLKPLDESIKTYFDIVPVGEIKCILPWKPPHFIAIFSEEKEGFLTNVGFMYEQLVLYLTARGIGTCWLGMAGFDSGAEVRRYSELPFVIIIAFGRAKGSPYRDLSEFRRMPLAEIADVMDEKLEPAHLAPSSTNKQPWYFTHEGDVFHAYRIVRGSTERSLYGRINKIDLGCALAHMYAANPDTFRFFVQPRPKELAGHCYVGSFTV